ncbi:hypothetical protein DFP73DRAFT_237088 [Morchella snyderi]|nr:hypothetical protein DFP73DRAFT_237088 [Morchella snyderi]
MPAAPILVRRPRPLTWLLWSLLSTVPPVERGSTCVCVCVRVCVCVCANKMETYGQTLTLRLYFPPRDRVIVGEWVDGPITGNVRAGDR